VDVVTLVPWRGGDRSRERVWDFIRPQLESLGYPLFTGDRPRGQWARAAACNAAAAAAGSWEIALVADADTVLESEAVSRTIERVRRTRAAARPHDHRYMLTHLASKELMRGKPIKPEWLFADAPGGGALVVHREAWETVGGYDERFIGWGYEDSAMNISLATTAGWERISGVALHLWHLLPNLRSHRAQRNGALLEELRLAKERELEAASRRAGYDLNTVL
jgi:N-terminal domain of galactosyltransferase